MKIALIREVFFDDHAHERLAELLGEARRRGAELAVLPELPCNSWCPASREPCDEDAEDPGGPRHRLLSAAARECSIGLVGGAIVRDPATGSRHDTALVFDARGAPVASYRKAHLPEEEGFWETDHYQPGDAPPERIDAFGMPIGVQICSDVNRPQGSQLLGALGAEAIVAPRSSERATYERWRLVFRANALTNACYVLSVNRPRPEQGVAIGGPSVAVDPSGDVIAETEEPVCVAELDRAEVERARRAYPGYLAYRAELYREGWGRLAVAGST